MKKCFCILFVLFLSACTARCAVAGAAPAKKIIAPGDTVPDHTFRYSLSSQDNAYFGIRTGFFSFFGGQDFSIQNIPTEIILIAFFNIYCTSCQAQAPVLNAVHETVMKTEGLRDKVRFIGVGAGNNSTETEQFRKEKQIAFPLIPDTDFAFYKAIGDPGGTPFTVIAKRTSHGLTVIAANLGLIKDAHIILQQIEEAAVPGAAGKPLVLESDLPESGSDRMLELRMPERELLEKVGGSMRTAVPAGTQTDEIKKITLSGGQTVYRGEFVENGIKTVLFSQAISRKPVCDVCHGVHFIITFDAAGTVRAFTPLHITKYGNVPWRDSDVQFMASRIVGRSIKKDIVFEAKADAVSTATMSSALIVNSIAGLRPLLDELSQYPR